MFAPVPTLTRVLFGQSLIVVDTRVPVVGLSQGSPVPGRVVGPMKPGTQSEICQLQVSSLVNQNVVWFDVPVNESQFVNALDRTNKLCDVETGGPFGKPAVLDQQAHHVPAWNVIHDEVQIAFVLE